MDFFATPFAIVLMASTKVLWSMFFWSHIAKSYGVRGTRGKYVFATAERTLLYPVLAFPILVMARSLLTVNLGHLVLVVLLLGAWAWARARINSADDDNFWSGKGRALGRRARSLVNGAFGTGTARPAPSAS